MRFKVRDRVEALKKLSGDIPKGTPGRVEAIHSKSAGLYSVKFDNGKRAGVFEDDLKKAD